MGTIDAGGKTFSGDSLLSGDRQGFGHVIGHPEILEQYATVCVRIRPHAARP